MPKLAQQLTELAASKAKPRKTAYALASGQGLFLLVLPSGVKQWQVRYREPEGRRGKKVVGIYPDMGIAAAHQTAAQLHQRIRMGESAVGLYDHLRMERETLTLAETQQQQETEDARKHSFTDALLIGKPLFVPD